MRTTKQMKVAKHMLAIWLKPNDNETYKESLALASSSWYNLPQRVLKSWVRMLHKDPSKYEFTGLAYKELYLKDHFSPEECQEIEELLIKYDAEPNTARNIRRYIIINKWVKKLSSREAIDDAFENCC